MKLFFFTAVDRNPVYRREAEILIASGKKYGRDIHLFDIPDSEIWNRYKVKLIASSDLPEADKYIYLDGDTVLTCHGDWESDECSGVADALYCWPDERIKHTQGFMRNHTLCIGEGMGFHYVHNLWQEMGLPIWCNSGVTVLKAEDRLPFTDIWREWMIDIDNHCEKGFMVGDEAPLMFARQIYGLPLLPPRFNGLCKWQPIYDWHVLIHADGNVSGEKRIPYNEAVEKVLK